MMSCASAAVFASMCNAWGKDNEPSFKRPNLVYVYADQMRGSAMGFLGEEPVITPNLDRLASEGLVLTDACVNYPVCVPYRTMLMSGRYSHSNGVITNCFNDGKEMDDSLVWWTDVLHQNGYDVAYYGKWHITMPLRQSQGKQLDGAGRHWLTPNKAHGISHWTIQTNNNHMHNTYLSSDRTADEPQQLEIWTVEHETDLAIKYIQNKDSELRSNDKPFALVMSFNPPHSPCGLVPQKYKDLYQKPPEEYCDGIKNLSPAGTKFGDVYRRQIRNYYAAISGIDDNLGRLFECLKNTGLDENTIIVFTADHGDNLGRHDCWDPKNTPYEEAMRVPFIMRWPGKIPAGRDDLLISTPDIYPTLLNMMGLEDKLPDGLEGTDLSQTILTGNGPRPTSQLYMFVPPHDHRYGRRGVRTHQYTLMLDRGWHGEQILDEVEITLWDRKSDPYQTKNIAADHPELVNRLIREELLPWLTKTNDPWLNGKGNIPTRSR